MYNIFIYLKNNCDIQQSCLRVEKEEIFFFMGHYQVILKLKKGECETLLQSKNDNLFLNITEINFTNINTSSIESVYIQCGTYLIEDEEELAERMYPYTFIANKLTSLLNTKFPQSVDSCQIGDYCVDDSCPMCGDVWEYGFTISVNNTYWTNLNFFLHFECTIKSLSNTELPSYYLPNKNIIDDYEINILPSNTKTRRIGYLKLILQTLDKHHKMPLISFNKEFEKYVQPYTKFLTTYKNKKGLVIETKTGNSAKPYTELAENLGLIHKTATYYELGKMGKVYMSIKQTMSASEENPFLLSNFDKAFFLEQLLKNDYLYLYTLMELICKESSPSYVILKQTYQKQLLLKLSMLLNQDSNAHSSKLLKLKIIERRIKSWDKPMKYLEHILMPRINWLYDIGFIDYKNKNSFSFTHEGLNCFLNLSFWNDMKMGIVLNPTNYINMYYVKIVNYIERNNAKPYTSLSERTFIDYLNQCFDLFKTIAPNRTTFSLAANYCKYMLWNQNQILLDIDEIKNLLDGKLNKYYIYKYQLQYKDGYIQKR